MGKIYVGLLCCLGWGLGAAPLSHPVIAAQSPAQEKPPPDTSVQKENAAEKPVEKPAATKPVAIKADGEVAETAAEAEQQGPDEEIFPAVVLRVDREAGVALQGVVVPEVEEEPAELGFQLPAAPEVQLLARYVAVNSALARRVCQLTDEQEQQLAQLDTRWIQTEVAKAGDNPVKQAGAALGGFLMQRLRPARRPRAARQQAHEVVVSVRKVIDEQIKSVLEPAQQASFQEELAARERFRREAQAGVMVAILDHNLYLTDAQRVSLQPKLATWLSEDNYWQFYFQNSGYVPSIPHHMLSDVLSADQLNAFKGIPSWNYSADQYELQVIGQEEQVVIER